MKTMFQRLHRTALIAFPLMSVLLLLYGLLFGSWPTVLMILWFASAGLLIMVLLACITRNVVLQWQAGQRTALLLRYGAGAAIGIAVLLLLDWTTGTILWGTDIGVGLLLGLLALYAKP